jgi:hypothetical protein
MDATADFAAVKQHLARPLPPYVSYEVVSHAGLGPFAKTENGTIVVRTSDGKIVKGKAPNIQIGADSDSTYEGDIVTHPPFKPNCYEATSAQAATFEGRAVEEIRLHDTCDHGKGDGDFNRVYVDPESHEPIAAAGGNTDEQVVVHVTERIERMADYFVPTSLNVTVKGSGWMAWLDVNAYEHISDYKFSNTAP